jgi:hypothetical protein
MRHAIRLSEHNPVKLDLTWNLLDNSKSGENQKELKLQKLFQITPSFSTIFFGNFYHPLAIFPVDNSIPAVIFELENHCSTAHLSPSSFPPRPTCRRALSTSMPCADRMQRHCVPLKAGRSDSIVRSCHDLVHASETPPRCRVLWCRRSILELHHDASVPTSPTTGVTRRSSSLAPVHSSAEPPPPPRTPLQ